MANDQRWLMLLSLGLTLAFSAGCEKTEHIARYTVDKPPPIEPLASLPGGLPNREPHAGLPRGPNPHSGATDPADSPPAGEPTDRMLGAIVPRGEKGWFFKLSGPKDVVAERADEFTSFLKSIHFSAEGNPHWTLPDGWQERGASGLRYATLLIGGGEKPLEISVTSLSGAADDPQGYALVNINRWRSQMKLPPITKEQLPAESSEIQVDGSTATMVNLLGAAPASMGGGPFSSGARNGK